MAEGMKLSEIFERAAEKIATGYSEFTCEAIGLSNADAVREFGDLFRPAAAGSNNSCAWGKLWSFDRIPRDYPISSGPFPHQAHACRVLALLFAAAIAKSEGK